MEPDNSGHYWNVPNFAMDQFADKEGLRWLCRFGECCERGRIAQTALITANAGFLRDLIKGSIGNIHSTLLHPSIAMNCDMATKCR